MSDGDNIIPFGPRAAAAPAPRLTSFDRRELGHILGLYGRMVALGEWRDYAIDHGPEAAHFSMYRRSGERPLFILRKTPADAQRQGAWALIGADGRMLKRGHDLEQVLSFFNRLLLRLAED